MRGIGGQFTNKYKRLNNKIINRILWYSQFPGVQLIPTVEYKANLGWTDAYGGNMNFKWAFPTNDSLSLITKPLKPLN